jgi:alpha-amylase
VPSVCFYFQVHQPFRLRNYHLFEVGTHAPYFDDKLNKQICEKVATKCYRPTNALLLDQIKRHPGKFKVSFSISGVALEQFATYTPDVLDSFRALAQTGQVEFLGETYYHSLSALGNEQDFARQVRKHTETLQKYLGVTPTVFRNTELIYNDHIAWQVKELGFKGMVTEGIERVLQGRPPTQVYQSTEGLPILTKHYQLSDDIAFRFSNQAWAAWPLNAPTFAKWVQSAGGETLNLFMDYETFGEHQWESTGIFKFMQALPEAVLNLWQYDFATPTEVIERYPVRGTMATSSPISWADSERDLSAWLGNPMQDSTFEWVYRLGKRVLAQQDEEITDVWGRLQTSDHFYYLCTKYWSDGDVHKYFSAYDSPHQAFTLFSNVLTDFELLLDEREQSQQLARPQAGANKAKQSQITPSKKKLQAVKTSRKLPVGSLAKKHVGAVQS